MAIDAIARALSGQASATAAEAKTTAEQAVSSATSAVPAAVTSWLNANVNPVGSAVVVDSSLSISGAAADAKVTGDEITDLKSAIKLDNVYNYCNDLTKVNSAPNGITFHWNDDGSCTVTGTATSAALNNLFASTNAMPSWMKAGGIYGIWNNGSITGFQITDNTNGGYIADCRNNTPALFKVPSNCSAVTIRLYVATGAANVNETIYPVITEYGIGWDRVVVNRYSANTLATNANNLIENVFAHVVSPYLTNAPQWPGWIEVNKTNEGLFVQRYFPDSPTLHPIVMRTYSNSSWSPWVPVGTVRDTVTILPQMTTESSYTRQSQAGTIYVSDRVIPAGAFIRKVNVYEVVQVTHKIYIIDNASHEVLNVVTKDCSAGWNEIIINYQTNSNVIIGSKGSVAFNYGSGYASYGLATSGLYEASESNPSAGDVVTIRKTAVDYYAFLLQWTYDIGSSETYAYPITSNGYQLDNGNLLRYKLLDSDQIGYVGRWFDYNGHPCTNTDGAELYFRTKGASSVTAVFGQITAQTVTPYIAISIDGGAFTRQQISTQTISLPDTNEHNVRIVMDGMTEAQGGSKWNNTIGVYVTSITPNAGTITGLLPMNKVGMFFGDSLTEGVNALGTSANASVNSATASYPFACCEYLNAVSYRVGYGSSGITVDGSFHKCIDAVDYDYNGQETQPVMPDFIVINHGINDGQATGTDFLAGYKAVINRLRIKYSSTPIFCVSPMRDTQPFWNRVEEASKDYPNAYFISSAGWGGDTTDGVHLSADGAKNNGKKLANAILQILGKEFFIA